MRKKAIKSDARGHRGTLATVVGVGGVLTIFLLLFLSQIAIAQEPFFSPTGNLGMGRYSFTLTPLPNGKILAAGGNGVTGPAIASAELYDPATGVWSPTGSMHTARTLHTATLLPNGKVLVAGGNGPSGQLSSAELYDPVSETWSPTGSMLFTSSFHSAVLLTNGKVLVAAGVRPGPGNATGTTVAELYDPQTGTWSPTGSLAVGRYFQNAVLLLDGTVLITGGSSSGGNGGAAATSAEIYNPTSGTWSPTGSMATGRWQQFTLTLLADGRVLATGGVTTVTLVTTNQAEIYDPLTKRWTATAPTPDNRNQHTATLLMDGTVLVAGGNHHPQPFGSGTFLKTTLIYDPTVQQWFSGPMMAGPRLIHQAMRLLNGKVLVAGGGDGAIVLSTAELFDSGVVPEPSLTLDVTGPATLSQVGGQYQPNPFDVVGTVANDGTATAQDIALTFYPPAGLTLATGSATQSIGPLSPGQQQQVTWSVRAAGQTPQATLSYFVNVVASNAKGKSAAGQIILPGGALTADVITPNSGGDAGSVSATIYGGGFLAGATAKLVRVGQPDIVGSAVDASVDGSTLMATFDLTGQALGVWDLVVTNLSGTSTTLKDAILVEVGQAASVWVDVLGHPAVKFHRAQPYTIIYGNRGNVDANSVSLWVAFPNSLIWSLPEGQQPRASGVTGDGDILLSFDIILIPPGSSGTVRVVLTAPNAGAMFSVKAWTKIP